MLRQVSRAIRSLVSGHSLRDHRFSCYHAGCKLCDGSNPSCPFASVQEFKSLTKDRPSYYLAEDTGLNGLGRSLWPLLALNCSPKNRELRIGRMSLMNRDKFCKRCIEGLEEFESYDYQMESKFSKANTAMLECYGCGRYHRSTMFSPAHLALEEHQRKTCIGREGFVRLCDHKDVEACLAELKGRLAKRLKSDEGELDKYGEEEEKQDLRLLIAKCSHSSHHSTCGQPGCNAGVRADLFYTRYGDYRIEMSWAAHSGYSTFPSYGPRGFEASEMRALFHRQRQNAAQFIVPPLYPGHLLEMACFRPSQSGCNCIYYGRGRAVDLKRGKEGEQHGECGGHVHLGLGPTDAQPKQHRLSIRRAWVPIKTCSQPPKGVEGASPCIVTTYCRIVSGLATSWT